MQLRFFLPLAVAALGLAVVAAPAQADMTVAQRIPAGDGGWDYASIDSDGGRLLVSRTDGVMTMDLKTRKVTGTFVPGARVHASFIIPGTGLGISTNGGTKSATLFDAATGKVTGEVATGAKPDAAVYDPETRTVWVMNGDDGTATIIDPTAGRAVGSVPIGGVLEFAVVDGHGHLFVNIEDKAEIAMVDIARRVVVRHTALEGCEEPSGLAMTKAGILIAACANGIAKTVDAATGRMLADIPIGQRPDAVLYDAARDRAYIPGGGDGTLTVIDTGGAAPHAIGKIATQISARTGAIDPATGWVYLPAARFAAAAAGERPKAVPGSFEILVVSP